MGSIQDPLAAFYGGYERTDLVRPPLFRIRPVYVAIAIALLALAGLIAADAGALTVGTATVNVTSVEWETGGLVLATAAGFNVHSSQTFLVILTCAGVCYRFIGASANAPFHVVAFSRVDSPIQFTNVTVQAPAGSYSGGLTISLALPEPLNATSAA